MNCWVREHLFQEIFNKITKPGREFYFGAINLLGDSKESLKELTSSDLPIQSLDLVIPRDSDKDKLDVAGPQKCYVRFINFFLNDFDKVLKGIEVNPWEGATFSHALSVDLLNILRIFQDDIQAFIHVFLVFQEAAWLKVFLALEIGS